MNTKKTIKSGAGGVQIWMPPSIRKIFQMQSRPLVLRYGVAVLSVIAATLILLWMYAVFHDAPHVTIFLCAVIFSAWFGGFGPGLLAIGLSFLAFNYYFLAPPDALNFEVAKWSRLAAFGIASTFVMWFTVAQRRAGEELKRNNQLLQAEIMQHEQNEEALRKSEGVLREAEALGQTGSWEQNLVTGEIFNSEANLHLFFGDDHNKGASLNDYVEVVYPDDREYVVKRRTELLEGGPPDIEYRVLWPDGSVHVIFGLATIVRDESGRAIRVYGTNVDVTERRRAEEELKRQTERAETLARVAARLNKQLDLDAVVHAVCQEIVDTFGVSQATMSLYDKSSDLLLYAGGVNIPPEYGATIEPISRAQFNELLQELGPIMVVPDIQAMPDVPNTEFSSRMDVRTVVTAAMLRDQELIGVIAFGVNGRVREFDRDELSLLKAISDQAAIAVANAQLLKAANEQHEQLRTLSARLVEAQENERQAIARELHDEIGQILTGLMMQLGMAKSHLSKSAKTVQTTLGQAEVLIQEAMERTRSIIAGLRPQVLDDLGLIPALRRLGDDFQENTGANVEIETTHLPQRLPVLLEVTLFRIVQEALTNVRKHAHARNVKISLAREDGQLVLSVQDDGIGLEKQTAGSRTSGDVVIEGGWRIPAGHFGLIGIQERAAQLGGRLQITSAETDGMNLRVELPISDAEVVDEGA